MLFHFHRRKNNWNNLTKTDNNIKVYSLLLNILGLRVIYTSIEGAWFSLPRVKLR